jgi:hypothetical protein
VSVIPIPELPETPEPPSSASTTVLPRLRLVAGHEHTWMLRAVEYDEALEVRRYECETCNDVLFR